MDLQEVIAKVHNAVKAIFWAIILQFMILGMGISIIAITDTNISDSNDLKRP
jgi:hypothetical protein